ncbi:MAG: hypothetical protein COV76_04815 [Candidatus Omnitrophica bacterium CG11_big_fil_rev_8_21_14_0_20_64_10]|nr:MAG: hypothetical protein COV76_04815 [Candidatus Omnitrophica bacterium CG11_big_fil_rev_8_21_14_0_20_64_10]
MKILTLNCWGTNGPAERLPVLEAALRGTLVDLLLLQETPPGLPEKLSGNTRLTAPDAGLSIISRFPAESYEILTYAAQSPTEKIARELLLVRLKTDGGPFWAATTHLSWRPEEEPIRLAQMEELVSRAERLSGPVLVGGDFNAAPDQHSIRRLAAAGWRDLFAEREPNEAGITWDNRNPFIQGHSVRFPDRRIDLLFLRRRGSEALRVAAAEVVFDQAGPEGLHPSDHYGVTARLSAAR